MSKIVLSITAVAIVFATSTFARAESTDKTSTHRNNVTIQVEEKGPKKTERYVPPTGKTPRHMKYGRLSSAQYVPANTQPIALN